VPGINLINTGKVLLRNSHIEAATQWMAIGQTVANVTVMGNHFTQNLASRGLYDSFAGIGGGGSLMWFDGNVFENVWYSPSGPGRIFIFFGGKLLLC
jgi:hypothetical protein